MREIVEAMQGVDSGPISLPLNFEGPPAVFNLVEVPLDISPASEQQLGPLSRGQLVMSNRCLDPILQDLIQMFVAVRSRCNRRETAIDRSSPGRAVRRA